MSADGFNKSVWMIVAQGGRWTSGEIKTALGMTGGSIDRAIYAMVRNGLLEKYPGQPAKYGISNNCITPRQTTVGEMLSAMGVA